MKAFVVKLTLLKSSSVIIKNTASKGIFIYPFPPRSVAIHLLTFI